MNEIAYNQLAAMASQPEALEASIGYIQRHISTFLRSRERVLICFVNAPGNIGYVMEQAVKRCGATPVIPGDLRWKTLLREAFANRCGAIIGTPLQVLGLAKLAKKMDTPLYARNVILAGYPSADWMLEGIRQGLDTWRWGCYDPGAGIVVGGFSCDDSGGIQLRSDVYGVQIVDETGNPVPEGELGEVVLDPLEKPEIRFRTGDIARMDIEECPCGATKCRMLDFDPIKSVDPDLSRLGAELQLWTSVLDCRLAKTGYGLEVEIVVFPGEKLPRLPSCAKLVIRNWDPEHDEPFPHMYILKKRYFSQDNG